MWIAKPVNSDGCLYLSKKKSRKSEQMWELCYSDFSGISTDIKTSALERNLKEYEALQLEAARMERDAQRVNMENALLEQVSR